MENSNSKKRLTQDDVSGFILDALFENRLPEELEQRIRAWLADEPDNESKVEALRKIYDDTVKAVAVVDEATYEHLKEIKTHLGLPIKEYEIKDGKVEVPGLEKNHGHEEKNAGKPEKKRLSLRTIMARAAVIMLPLLIISGGLLFITRPTQGDHTEVISYVSVTVDDVLRKHLILPDSSEVYVSRGSTIRYPEKFASREVGLEGEAYFVVVRSEGKPFVVRSGEMSVKVLGTEFKVRTATESNKIAEVAVTKGIVEVATSAQKLNLRQNELMVYDPENGSVTLANIGKAEVAPWKDVNLDFDNKPLREVFGIIKEYYGVTMSVDEKVLQDEIIIRAGFDDDESLEEVLQVLQDIVNNFRYTIDDKNVNIIKD